MRFVRPERTLWVYRGGEWFGKADCGRETENPDGEHRLMHKGMIN